MRAGFAALAARYDPTVLSSGFHETIEPILAREGVERRASSRTASTRGPTAGACSGTTPRRARSAATSASAARCRAGRPLVYVGDGYSDRCAALAADRVFARRDLADYLASRNEPFEPFETFDDVAAALA